ncbi:MAG: Jag N-terminal domain-containing protein [Candidatus Omnitrophota bacterium]
MKKNEAEKTIEVEDITVEKAIQKALKTLHAKKQEVTIRVLKEEQKGLFGMEGAEPAKIKVTLKPHK